MIADENSHASQVTEAASSDFSHLEKPSDVSGDVWNRRLEELKERIKESVTNSVSNIHRRYPDIAVWNTPLTEEWYYWVETSCDSNGTIHTLSSKHNLSVMFEMATSLEESGKVSVQI